MNEFFEAFAWVALVSYTFNVLVSFASGRPLVEWINPGRRYLPWFALTLLTAGYGLLTRAAWKYHEGHADLLRKLATQERAAPEVVVGVGLAIFAAAVLLLYAWCWWFLPRDPLTFSNNPRDLAREYGRALRHYVRWKGGLDFAAVLERRGGELVTVARAADVTDIARGLARVPRGDPAGAPTADDQVRTWVALAADLLAKWDGFDAAAAPAGQGACVAVSFDLTYGAVFLRMLEEPAADPEYGGLYLLAACLNQHEVNTLTAGSHYTLLYRAIRHIRDGVVAR
ncbi:MAG: hypothetical protein C0501_09815 [Isosphaera sp.]|nr:hypothetical protein [Isosphaera sp.]